MKVRVPPTLSPNLRQRIRLDPAAFAKAFFAWEPHEKQKEIIAASINPKLKNITVAAGRRGGKTEVVSVIIIHYGLTHKDSIQFVIAPTNEQASIIFNKILRFLSQNEDIRSSFLKAVRKSPFPVITLINDSQIHFRSAQHGAKYIRGHGERCERVVVDEAAFVDDDSIVNGIGPLLIDTGGQLIKISTPAGRNHFYDSYVNGSDEGGKDPMDGFKSIMFPSTANPHIQKDYLESKKREYGEESIFWKTEILARFLDDKAAVFPTSWITRAFTSRPFLMLREAEPGEIYVMGVDVAEQTDYNVISVLRLNPCEKEDDSSLDLVYFDRFHQQGLDYTAQQITDKIRDFQPVRCVIDQTGQIGNPLLLLIPPSEPTSIEPININPRSKSELVKYLSTTLERYELHIQPNDQTELLRDELKYFEYKIIEDNQRIKYGAPHDKHDDCVLSLALALYAAKTTTTAPVFAESAPKDSFLESMEKDFNAPNIPDISSYELDSEEDNLGGVVF